jgi:hypothetical protein
VAAAMERRSDKQGDSSTQQSQVVAGARGSQVRTIQGQSTPILVTQAEDSGAGIDESSCFIGQYHSASGSLPPLSPIALGNQLNGFGDQAWTTSDQADWEIGLARLTASTGLPL